MPGCVASFLSIESNSHTDRYGQAIAASFGPAVTLYEEPRLFALKVVLLQVCLGSSVLSGSDNSSSQDDISDEQEQFPADRQLLQTRVALQQLWRAAQDGKATAASVEQQMLPTSSMQPLLQPSTGIENRSLPGSGNVQVSLMLSPCSNRLLRSFCWDSFLEDQSCLELATVPQGNLLGAPGSRTGTSNSSIRRPSSPGQQQQSSKAAVGSLPPQLHQPKGHCSSPTAAMLGTQQGGSPPTSAANDSGSGSSAAAMQSGGGALLCGVKAWVCEGTDCNLDAAAAQECQAVPVGPGGIACFQQPLIFVSKAPLAAKARLVLQLQLQQGSCCPAALTLQWQLPLLPLLSASPPPPRAYLDFKSYAACRRPGCKVPLNGLPGAWLHTSVHAAYTDLRTQHALNTRSRQTSAIGSDKKAGCSSSSRRSSGQVPVSLAAGATAHPGSKAAAVDSSGIRLRKHDTQHKANGSSGGKLTSACGSDSSSAGSKTAHVRVYADCSDCTNRGQGSGMQQTHPSPAAAAVLTAAACVVSMRVQTLTQALPLSMQKLLHYFTRAFLALSAGLLQLMSTLASVTTAAGCKHAPAAGPAGVWSVLQPALQKFWFVRDVGVSAALSSQAAQGTAALSSAADSSATPLAVLHLKLLGAAWASKSSSSSSRGISKAGSTSNLSNLCCKAPASPRSPSPGKLLAGASSRHSISSNTSTNSTSTSTGGQMSPSPSSQQALQEGWPPGAMLVLRIGHYWARIDVAALQQQSAAVAAGVGARASAPLLELFVPVFSPSLLLKAVVYTSPSGLAGNVLGGLKGLVTGQALSPKPQVLARLVYRCFGLLPLLRAPKEMALQLRGEKKNAAGERQVLGTLTVRLAAVFPHQLEQQQRQQQGEAAGGQLQQRGSSKPWLLRQWLLVFCCYLRLWLSYLSAPVAPGLLQLGIVQSSASSRQQLEEVINKRVQGCLQACQPPMPLFVICQLSRSCRTSFSPTSISSHISRLKAAAEKLPAPDLERLAAWQNPKVNLGVLLAAWLLCFQLRLVVLVCVLGVCSYMVVQLVKQVTQGMQGAEIDDDFGDVEPASAEADSATASGSLEALIRADAVGADGGSTGSSSAALLGEHPLVGLPAGSSGTVAASGSPRASHSRGLQKINEQQLQQPKPSSTRGDDIYQAPSLLATLRTLHQSYASGELTSTGLAVQNGLDDVATAAEKLLAAVTGQDAVATTWVYSTLLALAVLVCMVGLGHVVFWGVAWLLRPPALRGLPGGGVHNALFAHFASQSIDSYVM